MANKNCRLLQDKIHNLFLRSILAPFYVCSKHKVECFLWILFTIVAGQLGTIINLIQRVIFKGWDFKPALAVDSSSGSFYTFSLVLIASLLAPLFINFIKDESPHYRRIGMVFVSILIFTLILCGVFYSSLTQNTIIVGYDKLHNEDMELDVSQFIFFLITIIFAFYYFGYSLMGEHEEDIGLSDDFQLQDDHAKEKLSQESSKIKYDGNNIRI